MPSSVALAGSRQPSPLAAAHWWGLSTSGSSVVTNSCGCSPSPCSAASSCSQPFPTSPCPPRNVPLWLLKNTSLPCSPGAGSSPPSSPTWSTAQPNTASEQTPCKTTSACSTAKIKPTLSLVSSQSSASACCGCHSAAARHPRSSNTCSKVSLPSSCSHSWP